MADGSILDAVSASPRALVFLTVPWSGPERHAHELFGWAVTWLELGYRELGIEFFSLDEEAEWCQAWLQSLDSPNLGGGYARGAGSVLWLESGRLVGLELAPANPEAEDIFERTVTLWAGTPRASNPTGDSFEGLTPTLKLDSVLDDPQQYLGGIYTIHGLFVTQEQDSTRRMECWLVRLAEFDVYPEDSPQRFHPDHLWGPVSGRRFDEIVLDLRHAAFIESDEVSQNAISLFANVGGSEIDMYALGSVTGRVTQSLGIGYAIRMTEVSRVDILGFNLVESEVDFQRTVGVDESNLHHWF